jgi:hypothetical protein
MESLQPSGWGLSLFKDRMNTTLKEDSPPEDPIIKGPWQQVMTQDKRKLVRTRDVWLDGLTEVAARETRIDIQGSDNWVEVASLSAAYLRRLRDSYVPGNPEERKPLRTPQKAPTARQLRKIREASKTSLYS